MKKTTRIFAASLALVGCFAFTGCSTNDSSDSSKSDTSASASASDTSQQDSGAGDEEGALKVNARPDECNNQELQGPEESLGPFDISVKFFQPGEMIPSPNSTMWMEKYADSQMHLEVDTKANAFGTNWGYSVDETPANLHMMYVLMDDSKKVISQGMMMEMNASDGAHYGTNLKNDTIKKAGDYTLKITVYPPVAYDLHSDYLTGVPATDWFKPLTAEMDWKITQDQLDTVNKAKVSDPKAVPDKCKKYPVKMYEDKTAQKAMEKAESVAPVPMEH